MKQYNRTTRFLAAMLMGGGFCGVAIAVFTCIQLMRQSVLVAMLIAVIGALFVWATFTGIRLWQGTPYGRKWAVILFASQVPALVIPDLKYQWFTGVQFGPTLAFGGGPIDFGMSVNVGANGEFFVGAAVTESTFGFNLFAAIAVVLLVRANRSFSANR